jgi:hypothetical protein
MSAGHDDGSQLMSITIATLVPTVGGVAMGLMAAMAIWPAGNPLESYFGSYLGRLVAGAFAGGITGLLLAWFMAWHASTVAAVPDRPDASPVWGAVPAILFGFSLGPLFAGVVGGLFGYLLPAIYFGLFAGPIVALVGWEIAYFATRRMQARSGH